jgi:hypothetical protein
MVRFFCSAWEMVCSAKLAGSSSMSSGQQQRIQNFLNVLPHNTQYMTCQLPGSSSSFLQPGLTNLDSPLTLATTQWMADRWQPRWVAISFTCTPSCASARILAFSSIFNILTPLFGSWEAFLQKTSVT